MGAADKFLEFVKARRTIYTLAKESTIPDSRVEEIVKFALIWAPSTYNVQSARAVILFNDKHDKMWDIATKHMLASVASAPEATQTYIRQRLAGHRDSYGTVLFFEDQVALAALGEKNARSKPMLTECENPWDRIESG